ncbi:hypothetical protein [uncultured Thiohalocapsa sp.]|uniref:hypothetical protein n=1 Tax=uncultured Thiohalocapsa sp. TaxID=768990 RepID=UPI0025EB1225|nr:hypothetical protein [uncultured Thiohalocapsa sp.]
MTPSHLLHRCHQSRRAKTALRLRARQLRAATVGGAVALGAIAVPGPTQAATVTINTAVNGTQFIGGGNDLEITAGGSITAPGSGSGDDGVRESAPGASIGSINNAGSITATDSGIGASTGATVGDISNSGSISAGLGIGLFAATANGNITNSGSIEGFFVGISAAGSSTIDGAIQNQAGGTVSGSFFSGIQVSGGSVSNGISNAGSITGFDAISIFSAEINGGITNTGSIQGGYITDRIIGGGLGVYSSAVITGGITNSGSIEGDNRVSEDGSIFISSPAQVTGGISNTGSLTGLLQIFGSDGAGGGIDVTNSGDIDLLDSESNISGDFTQTGTGTLAITLLAFGDYTAAPLGIVGDASIDGDLLLDLDPGFAFSALDRLTLIGAGGTRTGTFSNYADGDLVYAFDSRRRMYLDYTADGVDLYTTPIPGTPLLIGLGLFAWAGARARRARG